MRKLLATVLLLTACEEDSLKNPAAELDPKGSECLQVIEQGGDDGFNNDWQLCNVSGQTYFCTAAGCLPIGCSK